MFFQKWTKSLLAHEIKHTITFLHLSPVIRGDGACPVSRHGNNIMSVYIQNLCTFAA